MTVMENEAVHDSSYTPPPTENGRYFFGRETTTTWLQEQLAAGADAPPLLISGAPGIGKTALLRRLAARELHSSAIPIIVNIETITHDSLSGAVWDLATTAAGVLQSRGLSLHLNQTTFVAQPLRALQTRLIEPARQAFPHTPLLWLCDNLQSLQPQAKDVDLLPQLLPVIHNGETSFAVFTLRAAAPPATDETADLLGREAAVHHLTGLSESAAMEFSRQIANLALVNDVAGYIYTLTGGHPQKMRRLCQAVADYQQTNQLRHVTVADVAMVQKYQLAQQETAVSTLLPIFSIQPNPALDQTIHKVRRRTTAGQRPLWIGGIVVLLLILLLIPRANRQAIGQQLGLAATSTATAAATPPLSLAAGEPQTAVVEMPTETPAPTETAVSTHTPTATGTTTPTGTPTATPTSSGMPPTFTRTTDGMPMILIPAGTFIMGSANDDVLAAPDETPQREVTLDAFYIDRYEVSVEQFAAFLNRLGNHDRACDGVDCALPRSIAGYTSYITQDDIGDGSIQYIPLAGYAKYPANHVSWHGANSYCQSVGARLPTEAEWEYAARGSDGRIYPWGNAQPNPDLAVFQSENYDNMKPVDALPDGRSPFGVYAMAGSLWEWVADWYDENYYSTAPDLNPPGPESGLNRVLRGGAWPYNNQADRIRAANRFFLAPDFISSTVGFRCARDP